MALRRIERYHIDIGRSLGLKNGIIEPVFLPAQVTGTATEALTQGPDANLSRSIDERIDEVERGLIIEALSRSGGVQVKAAEILGINQRSLWHRIKKLGIDVNSLKNQQKM